MFQSVSIFSLYNPLFQCFKTPEMGPGIFTFFRACFNFVSKRLKRLALVNFCHVSFCFKNVSKQLKRSAIFIIFSELQSFETTETIEPFGLVLDLVNFQRFISVYSFYVSMFH